MAIRTYNGIEPRIHETAYIDPMAVLIGDVTVAADTSVWPMVTARGDVQSISIGAQTNIQDGSILHVTSDNRFTPGGHKLSIGSRVTVGHGVILHACTVHDLCLIGMGSTILDGAVVESKVLIGAGSVVPPGKTLTSGYLYLGSPARLIRPLNGDELEYLNFSWQHYVELKNNHVRTSSDIV